MAQESPKPRTFGCGDCFQGDAAVVWKRRPFKNLAALVDDSHFGIDVMICPACDQHCVKVFMEFVDWANSDDAQCWVVVPLTHAESVEIIALGDKVRPEDIHRVSANRNYLLADFPSGGGSKIEWRPGPPGIVIP